MSSTFLTPEEVADLTDIRTGKGGKTREQLQIAALNRMKIPHVVSAIGRPKVARAVFEGIKDKSQNEAAGWEPVPA